MPVDTCGLAALVAVKTGRPALLAYTREESMIAHTKRHPFQIRIKSGVKKDGRLTAWEAELFADTGAFASLGPLVVIRALFHSTGPYVIPYVKSDSYCIYTNNTMCGSFRGFGGPQSAFAAECHMDAVAHKLGMDPLDLRLKNMLRPGTLTATSQVVDEACGLEACVTAVTKESDWYRKRSEFEGEEGTIRRGMGIAMMYHGNSLGPEGSDYAAVHAKIEPNGRIVLRTGLTEYGTGAPSGLVQIASETLGVPVEFFALEKPDTAYCEDTGPTVASRTITIGGRAAILAAEQLRERLLKVAALKLQCDEKELNFRDDVAASTRRPEKRISYVDLVKEAYQRDVDLTVVGHFVAPRCEFDPETSQGTTYLQYTYGAVIAEVSVDTEIGKLTIDRLTVAYDVGKTINPLGLIGQIEGGTVQGLGYGTIEDLVHTDGRVENPNLADYYIPTSMDIPEIKTIIVEYPGALGPYGAKAMGEPPIDLPAAAIANAVGHALGVGITEIPVTPARILAIAKARAS
jgi:CO/xanthine dehydrogenase Mo-binding subunit